MEVHVVYGEDSQGNPVVLGVFHSEEEAQELVANENIYWCTHEKFTVQINE